MSLYVDRPSVIHRLDPLTKLCYIAAAVAVPFICPVKSVALLVAAVTYILLAAGRVVTKVLPLLGFVAPVLLSIFIIQGMFMPDNHALVFRIGPLHFYKEGLSYAALLSLRVIGILGAFSLLVLTTKPSDLIQALMEKGLPPEIGYVLNAVLQIIPQMANALQRITDAQRARGLETDGRLSDRIKAFFPLIGPVVMNAFVETKDRAMALEVRAFNSKTKRTFLHVRKKHPADAALRIMCLAAIILAVVWRLAG